MKIKFGAIVTDGRGKLGGHVFSKNNAGSYIRTKVTPSNPQTTAQSQARQLFGTISAGWSGLTEAQRSAWNSAVELWQTTDIFGDLKKPTGKALYQRLNNQAQSAGYSAVTDAPAKETMVEGVLTATELDTTAPELILSGAYTGADARIMVFATPKLSPGTKFVKNKLRNIYNATGSGYLSTDAYNAYVAKFGVPAGTDNIYIGVKYVLANGQASPMQTLKAIITV